MRQHSSLGALHPPGTGKRAPSFKSTSGQETACSSFRRFMGVTGCAPDRGGDPGREAT